jgi:glutathione synthase
MLFSRDGIPFVNGHPSRFLDRNQAQQLHLCFAKMYSLGCDEEGDSNTRMAREHPADYVMKPQREGGGNNIYDMDIPISLNRLTWEERSTYILMEKIRAPRFRTILLREGQSLEEDAISELGIFGIYLVHEEKIILNQAAGHLLRTKAASVNEGGVASGFSVLDSPYLIE